MACAVVTSITGDSLFALIVLALLEPVLHAPAKSATAKSIKSAGVKIRITFMNSLPLGAKCPNWIREFISKRLVE